MSATTAMPGAATAPAHASWFRRHRAALLIGVAVVAATTFSIIGSSGKQHTEPLDPAYAGPTGARAVARVLENQGIDVQVVRSAAAFDKAAVNDDTTVVVTSSADLGRSALDRLTAHTGGARVILVDPGFAIADHLDQAEGIPLRGTAKTRGVCSDPTLTGLSIESRSGTAFPLGTGTGCFRVGGGYLITEPNDALTFLGAADLLSNEQVSRSDNAAIALRLLGQHPRLVWYVANADDQVGDDAISLRSLLPRWLGPSSVLLAVALIALIGWRGRRLGRLATEPLPVVVTAIESTQSRGRLYRKVNERSHAAAALRRAARTRLATHLGLPRQAALDVESLIRDVAPHSTLDLAALHRLLSEQGPVPNTDNDLILLANDLAELMREVRRS
jgi:hypothetical protein